MFIGFTPETVDFLWGIRWNNNREWFTAHKKQYTDTLYEPMKAMGKDLFQPFLEKSGSLLKVSRIYRDARLHPPTPYKDSLWVCIRQDVQSWEEAPCLYFEINPEGVDYGFSVWKPKPATMEAFRRRIAAKPDEFLTLLRQAEEALGQPIMAETYKRPKPCENPELLPYFAWKGKIGFVRHEDFGDAVFGPQLGSRVLDFFVKLIPLYDYFNQFNA